MRIRKCRAQYVFVCLLAFSAIARVNAQVPDSSNAGSLLKKQILLSPECEPHPNPEANSQMSGKGVVSKNTPYVKITFFDSGLPFLTATRDLEWREAVAQSICQKWFTELYSKKASRLIEKSTLTWDEEGRCQLSAFKNTKVVNELGVLNLYAISGRHSISTDAGNYLPTQLFNNHGPVRLSIELNSPKPRKQVIKISNKSDEVSLDVDDSRRPLASPLPLKNRFQLFSR